MSSVYAGLAIGAAGGVVLISTILAPAGADSEQLAHSLSQIMGASLVTGLLCGLVSSVRNWLVCR